MYRVPVIHHPFQTNEILVITPDTWGESTDPYIYRSRNHKGYAVKVNMTPVVMQETGKFYIGKTIE